jgi:hypothetical protein
MMVQKSEIEVSGSGFHVHGSDSEVKIYSQGLKDLRCGVLG